VSGVLILVVLASSSGRLAVLLLIVFTALFIYDLSKSKQLYQKYPIIEQSKKSFEPKQRQLVAVQKFKSRDSLGLLGALLVEIFS